MGWHDCIISLSVPSVHRPTRNADEDKSRIPISTARVVSDRYSCCIFLRLLSLERRTVCAVFSGAGRLYPWSVTTQKKRRRKILLPRFSAVPGHRPENWYHSFVVDGMERERGCRGDALKGTGWRGEQALRGRGSLLVGGVGVPGQVD